MIPPRPCTEDAKVTRIMIAQASAMNDETDEYSSLEPRAIYAPPDCYSLTLFTHRWREVRDFYVDILDAEILSERPDRYCEMNLGGLPICLRAAEQGEMLSYLHLYIALPNRTRVLHELQSRGIIITKTGPYVNFRDPEGRVVKLSDAKSVIG